MIETSGLFTTQFLLQSSPNWTVNQIEPARSGPSLASFSLDKLRYVQEQAVRRKRKIAISM